MTIGTSEIMFSDPLQERRGCEPGHGEIGHDHAEALAPFQQGERFVRARTLDDSEAGLVQKE